MIVLPFCYCFTHHSSSIDIHVPWTIFFFSIFLFLFFFEVSQISTYNFFLQYRKYSLLDIILVKRSVKIYIYFFFGKRRKRGTQEMRANEGPRNVNAMNKHRRFIQWEGLLWNTTGEPFRSSASCQRKGYFMLRSEDISGESFIPQFPINSGLL